MEQERQAQHRPPAAERLAGSEHLLKLDELAAQLAREAAAAHQGHHQITLYHQGNMRVVLFTFEQGGQLHEHQANGDVTIHLLAGKVKVTTAEHDYELLPAQMVALAPAVRHSVLAAQPSTLLLTICLKATEETNG